MITEFFKPATIEEALQLKSTYPEALYMAGGSWINSSRSATDPEVVISLSGLGLNFIRQEGAFLSIGATTTLQDIADHSLTPDFLRTCLKQFRNRNIRNQATLAGMIATKNPAFSSLTALIAANAEVETPSQKITVEDYITTPQDGLISTILIPLNPRVCARKHSVTARGVSLVSVAAGFSDQGIRLVVAQDGGKIERLKNFEKKFDASMLKDRDNLSNQIKNAVVSFDDYRTSGAFKKYIAGVMLADCLIQAAEGV